MDFTRILICTYIVLNVVYPGCAEDDTLQKAPLPYIFNLDTLPSLGDLGSNLPLTLPSLTTLSDTPTVSTPSVAPTTTSRRKKRSDKISEAKLNTGEDSIQGSRLPYVFNLGGLPSLGDLGASLPLTLPSLTTLGGSPTITTPAVTTPTITTPTITTPTDAPTTASSRKKRSEQISESKLSAGEDSVLGARSPYVFNLGGLPSLGDLGSSLPLTLPPLTTLSGAPTVTTSTVAPTTASSRRKRSEEVSEAKLSAGEDSVQGARSPYIFNLGGLPSLGDLGANLPLTLPSLTTLGGSPTITTPALTTPTITTPTITTPTNAPTTASSRKKRSEQISESKLSAGEDSVLGARSPYVFNLGGLPSLGDLGSSLPLTLPPLTTLSGAPTVTTPTVAPTTASSRRKRSEVSEAKLSAGKDSVQGARSPYVFNLGGLPSLGDLGANLPLTLPSLTTLGGSPTITTPALTTPTITTPTITTPTDAPTTTSSRKKRSDQISESKLSAGEDSVQGARSPYVFNLGGLPSLGDLGSGLPLTLPSLTTLGGTPTLTTPAVAPTTASSRRKRSEEVSESKVSASEDSIQGARSPYVFNLGGLPSLGDFGANLPLTLPSLTTLGGSPTMTTPALTTPTITTPTITTPTDAPTTASSRKKRSEQISESKLSAGEDSVLGARSPYVFNLGGLPSLGDLGSSLPLTLPPLTTLSGAPTVTTSTVAPTTASSRRKRSEEVSEAKLSAGEDSVQGARSPYIFNLGGLPSLGDLGANLPLTLPSLTTLGGSPTITTPALTTPTITTPTITTPTNAPTTASSRKKRSEQISESKLSAGEDSVLGARSPYVFNLGRLPSLGDLGSSLPLTLPPLTTLSGAPTVTTPTVAPTTASSRRKRSEVSEAKLSAGEDSVQGARSPYVFNLGGLPSLGDLGANLPLTLPSLSTLGGSPTITTPALTTPTITTPTITTPTDAPTTTSSRKKRSDQISESKLSAGEDSVQGARSPYVFNLGGLPSLGDLGSGLPLTLPSLTTLGGTPTLTTPAVAPTTASSRRKRSEEVSESKVSASEDSIQGARSPYVFNLGGLPSLGDFGANLPLTLPSLTTLGGSPTMTTPALTTPTITTPTITTPTDAPTTASSRKKRSEQISESKLSAGEDSVQGARSPYVFNLGGLPSLGDLGSGLPLTLPSLTTLGGTPTITTPAVAPTTASSRRKRSEEVSEAKVSASEDSIQGARSPYVFNLGGLPSLGDLGANLPLTLPSLTTLGGSPTITTPALTTPTITTPTITTPTDAPITASSRKKRSEQISESKLSAGEDSVQGARSPYVFNLGGLPSLGDLGSSLPLTLPPLTTLGGTPTVTTPTVAPTTASSRRKRSPVLLGLLPNIVSCNHTAQPGATCRSCQEALNCFSNNIGLVQKCRGRSPHCNEGRCSNTQSAECGGTTTSSSTSTTAAPVTTEAAVSTTTAEAATTEATTTAEPATTEAAASTTTTEPTSTEAAVSTTSAAEPATTETTTNSESV